MTESERNSKLQISATQSQKRLKLLIDDSVALLKSKMTELAVNNATSSIFLFSKYAKDIALKYKTTRQFDVLREQVTLTDREQTEEVTQERICPEETASPREQTHTEVTILKTKFYL